VYGKEKTRAIGSFIALFGLIIMSVMSSCAAGRSGNGLTASGNGRAASTGKQALEAKTTQVSTGPMPKIAAEIVFPSIERKGTELLVAYRHTGHAFLDVYGYDTVILRFAASSGGRFSGVKIYRRMMEGEALAKSYRFIRRDDDIDIVSDIGKDKDVVRSLSRRGSALTMSPEEGLRFSYGHGESGTLGFERESGFGLFVEEWSPAGGGTVHRSRNGTEIAGGRFEKRSSTEDRYIERLLDDPNGAEDVTMTIQTKGEETRIRTEGIEPLNECLVLGLAAWLSKDAFLENTALIDLSVGLATDFVNNPGLRPLFARSFFSLR
jgi:hypothetical protein